MGTGYVEEYVPFHRASRYSTSRNLGRDEDASKVGAIGRCKPATVGPQSTTLPKGQDCRDISTQLFRSVTGTIGLVLVYSLTPIAVARHGADARASVRRELCEEAGMANENI